MNGACDDIFFAPPPGTLGRGQKVKYQLISITKSRFLYQTLCVFSQDKKHIGRDFNSVAWVMPQGWNFGRWVCPYGHLFCKNGNVAYQIDGDDGQNRMQVKYFHPRVKLVTLR